MTTTMMTMITERPGGVDLTGVEPALAGDCRLDATGEPIEPIEPIESNAGDRHMFIRRMIIAMIAQLGLSDRRRI